MGTLLPAIYQYLHNFSALQLSVCLSKAKAFTFISKIVQFP